MHSSRINPYLLPHKGLRNLLSQVSLKAGNVDVTDVKSVLKLKALSNELFYLLEQHAHVEDVIILPDLEKRVPGSTHENHEEHELLDEIVAQLQRQVNALKAGGDPQDFVRYFYNVSDFHSRYLAHMLLEEREVLAFIWESYTDEELQIQHHEIISSFSPEKILRWFRFIIPALNPQERELALGGIKKNAPKEFWDELMKVVGVEIG